MEIYGGSKSKKIDNSYKAAIKSGKWSNPGAKLYDSIMKDYTGDWREMLDEAYLITGSELNNDPHRGRTPYSRSGCKYPHHVMRGGKLVVSIPGLKAAYARAKQMGVFSGKVRAHLERHYKQLHLYDDSTMKADQTMKENFEYIESVINGILGTELYEEDTRVFDIDELLTEKQHSSLKVDHRMSTDADTGHKLHVIYSLDGIILDQNNVVGYKKRRASGGGLGDDAVSDLKKYGNTDHMSHNQKVLAIIDMETGENIKNRPVSVEGVFGYGGDKPSTIQVGKVDPVPRFKSTFWSYGMTGDDEGVVRLSSHESIGQMRGVKGHQMDEIPGNATVLAGVKGLNARNDVETSKKSFNDKIKQATTMDDEALVNSIKTSLKNDKKKINSSKWDMFRNGVTDKGMAELRKTQGDAMDLERMLNNQDYDSMRKKLINDAQDKHNAELDKIAGIRGYSSRKELREKELSNRRKPLKESVEFDDYMDEYFEEKSHGKLKVDHRLAVDIDTGHQLHVIYSLDGIKFDKNFTLQGQKGDSRDGLSNPTNNIYPGLDSETRRLGNTNHSSYNQKVLAIIDLETGENIKDRPVRTKGPFGASTYSNEKPHTIQVGEVDMHPSFKSTLWNFKDGNVQDIMKAEHIGHLRGHEYDKAYVSNQESVSKTIQNCMNKIESGFYSLRYLSGIGGLEQAMPIIKKALTETRDNAKILGKVSKEFFLVSDMKQKCGSLVQKINTVLNDKIDNADENELRGILSNIRSDIEEFINWFKSMNVLKETSDDQEDYNESSDVDVQTDDCLNAMKKRYNQISKTITSEEDKVNFDDAYGRESHRLESLIKTAKENPTTNHIQNAKKQYKVVEEILDNFSKDIIKEYEEWIDRYVHEDYFREHYEEEFEDSTFFERNYHVPAPTRDFRMGYDLDTGHQMKIVYSLDDIKIDNVGTHYMKGHNYPHEELQDYMDKIDTDEFKNHKEYLAWVKKNINKEGNTDHLSHGQKVIAIIDMVDNSRKDHARIVGPDIKINNSYVFNNHKLIQDDGRMALARVLANINYNIAPEVKVGEKESYDYRTFKSTFWSHSAYSPDDAEKIRKGEISKTDAPNHRWEHTIRAEDLKSSRSPGLHRMHPEGMLIQDVPNSDTFGSAGFKIFDNPNREELLGMLQKLQKGYDKKLRKETSAESIEKGKEALTKISDDIEKLKSGNVSRKELRRISLRWLGDPSKARPKIDYLDLDEYSVADVPHFFDDCQANDKAKISKCLHERLACLEERADALLGKDDHGSLEKYKRYRRQIDRINDHLSKLDEASELDTYRIVSQWKDIEEGDSMELYSLQNDPASHKVKDIFMGPCECEKWPNFIYKADYHDSTYEEEFYNAAGGDLSRCFEEYSMLPDNCYYILSDFGWEKYKEYLEQKSEFIKFIIEKYIPI